MRVKNLNGLLIYTSKINGTELFIMADETLVESIQDITQAYIVGGQVFIRLADRLNMEFGEKLVGSITQNTKSEFLVTLNHRSVDLDTIGIISRKMPKDSILTSIKVEEFMINEDGDSGMALCLIYRKANNSSL